MAAVGLLVPLSPASAQEKVAYVRNMFARIAGRYDRMSRLMALGRDQAWRRHAVALADLPPGGHLLDVATGTGDMALAALRGYPEATVVGVDFSGAMMRVGRGKSGAEWVRWAGGDVLRLPFPDASFDAVVSGFVMRNVTDVGTAFAEQRRVVRPGGRVVCLEIARPTAPVLGALFRLYFHRLAPPITGRLSGHPDAYRYLPRSVDCFLTPEELKATMERVGLQNVRYRMLALGTVAVHVGIVEDTSRRGNK